MREVKIKSEHVDFTQKFLKIGVIKELKMSLKI